MKNTFINIVQKCICVDFVLNELINSNSYHYLNFLSNMKNENLRNIKVICYLYEYVYKENLNLDNISPLKLNKSCDDTPNTLLEFNFSILSELDKLKKSSFNAYYFKLVQGLINSYINFISFIHCFCPLIPPNKRNYLTSNNTISYFNVNSPTLNYRFFYMLGEYSKDSIPTNYSLDFIRDISIDAVNVFFDYSLLDNIISDEQYEVFFENNSQNKFYQYFFKSSNFSFKIRVMDKSPSVFYIYQSVDNAMSITPSLNKNEAIIFSTNYIKNKFKDIYSNLLFDETYTNVSTYMDTI
ncbi:MAG: hypothetical protein RR942_10690, partial [Romboutsia sp.]